jgi:hypothetical protein
MEPQHLTQLVTRAIGSCAFHAVVVLLALPAAQELPGEALKVGGFACRALIAAVQNAAVNELFSDLLVTTDCAGQQHQLQPSTQHACSSASAQAQPVVVLRHVCLCSACAWLQDLLRQLFNTPVSGKKTCAKRGRRKRSIEAVCRLAEAAVPAEELRRIKENAA